MTVCIVDDNATVNAQLKLLLVQAGVHDALGFTDSRRALKWCLETRPELILLDYNMPELDGLEFLAELKRHQATENIPVAMISGWAVETMRIAALRAGAIDVIGKPFVAEEVKLKVFNLLRLTDAHRDLLRRPDAPRAGLSGDLGLNPALDHPDDAVIELLERLNAIRSDRSGRSLKRTGLYAATIGAACGLTELQQALLCRAAPFHDVGSGSVPSGVLARSAPLDEGDRRLLDHRAVAGYEVLRGHQSPVMQMAAEIAQSCLEHWDGSGTPYGLAGENIPLSGRITALADMFEQMTLWRGPNMSGLSAESAAAVIRADEGQQFDPTLVRAFERALPRLMVIMDHHRDDELPDASWDRRLD